MSLSPEDEDLLASARVGLEPTSDDKKRVRGAIAAHVGLAASLSSTAGAAGAGAASTTGTTVAAASSAGGLGKITMVLAALAITAGVGVGGFVATRPEVPRAPVAAPVETTSPPVLGPAPVERAPLAATPPVPSATSEERTGPKAPPKVPPHATVSVTSTAPPANESSLSVETHLVRDATAALQRGDAAGALAALEDHARRFPHGVLAEERDAQRVLALCALGRTSEAKSRASRFAEQHPRSALTGKVRGSCAGP